MSPDLSKFTPREIARRFFGKGQPKPNVDMVAEIIKTRQPESTIPPLIELGDALAKVEACLDPETKIYKADDVIDTIIEELKVNATDAYSTYRHMRGKGILIPRTGDLSRNASSALTALTWQRNINTKIIGRNPNNWEFIAYHTLVALGDHPAAANIDIPESVRHKSPANQAPIEKVNRPLGRSQGKPEPTILNENDFQTSSDTPTETPREQTMSPNTTYLHVPEARRTPRRTLPPPPLRPGAEPLIARAIVDNPPPKVTEAEEVPPKDPVIDRAEKTIAYLSPIRDADRELAEEWTQEKIIRTVRDLQGKQGWAGFEHIEEDVQVLLVMVSETRIGSLRNARELVFSINTDELIQRINISQNLMKTSEINNLAELLERLQAKFEKDLNPPEDKK